MYQKKFKKLLDKRRETMDSLIVSLKSTIDKAGPIIESLLKFIAEINL